MTDIVNAVRANFPPQSWTTDPDIIAPWLTEWRDKYFGNTPVMLMPSSTAETADMVGICADLQVPIVPQGGNTGLVGGQTPMGEVLLSTRKLTKVREANPVTNSLVAEAGVTLLEVQQAAETIGRKFPLSLASEGSCTIGGNLSTNAGGVHVLKYGTSKELVFGVEAVLPNGEIYNGLTSLRKDNTGYDLSRLFLGAEGTLGIITAASLKLFPRPGHIQRALIGTDNSNNALKLLDLCQHGNTLAMFEVIPRFGIELVTQHIPGRRDPFDSAHAWYVLVDWEVETEAEGLKLAEQKLSSALELSLINDAIIAQSGQQSADLLALREYMSEAQKYNGGSVKLDVTLPIDRIPDFLEEANSAVKKVVKNCRPLPFGHLGDGNIHYNVAQPKNMDKEEFLSYWEPISDAVFDIIDSMNGSISAEHGIGTMKREALATRADPVKLSMLKAIKSTLDPHNIMNPRSLI